MLRPLTTRDNEVLSSLRHAAENNRGLTKDGWMRPMDIGGSDCSYHHAVLKKLVKRGLVLEKRRCCSMQGMLGSSCVGRLYRIAPSN